MPTKCKLVYLRPASDDFQEIVKFHINEVGVQSARKIYVTMRDAINKLADFPLMVAIYKVENGIVYLYRIVNGATDYPKLLK